MLRCYDLSHSYGRDELRGQAPVSILSVHRKANVPKDSNHDDGWSRVRSNHRQQHSNSGGGDSSRRGADSDLGKPYEREYASSPSKRRRRGGEVGSGNTNEGGISSLARGSGGYHSSGNLSHHSSGSSLSSTHGSSGGNLNLVHGGGASGHSGRQHEEWEAFPSSRPGGGRSLSSHSRSHHGGGCGGGGSYHGGDSRNSMCFTGSGSLSSTASLYSSGASGASVGAFPPHESRDDLSDMTGGRSAVSMGSPTFSSSSSSPTSHLTARPSVI